MYRKPQQQPPPAQEPRPLARPEPIPFAEPWNYELHFPRDPRGPRIARVTLRAVLGSHGLQELVERAELLTSELTTNAVCHTSGPAFVGLHWLHPALRVSVWDTNPHRLPSPTGRLPDSSTDARTGGASYDSDSSPAAKPSERTSGRGLLLLDVFADQWGVRTIGDGPWGPGGKTVWFELRLGGGVEPVLAA